MDTHEGDSTVGYQAYAVSDSHSAKAEAGTQARPLARQFMGAAATGDGGGYAMTRHTDGSPYRRVSRANTAGEPVMGCSSQQRPPEYRSAPDGP